MIHCVSITNMSRLVFNHQMIYTAALTSQRRSSRTFLKYTDILLPLIKMYQHFTPTALNMSRFFFTHQMIWFTLRFRRLGDVPQIYRHSAQTLSKCNKISLQQPKNVENSVQSSNDLHCMCLHQCLHTKCINIFTIIHLICFTFELKMYKYPAQTSQSLTIFYSSSSKCVETCVQSSGNEHCG